MEPVISINEIPPSNAEVCFQCCCGNCTNCIKTCITDCCTSDLVKSLKEFEKEQKISWEHSSFDEVNDKQRNIFWSLIHCRQMFSSILYASLLQSWLSIIVKVYWISNMLPDASFALTYWIAVLFLTAIVSIIPTFMSLIRWNKAYILYPITLLMCDFFKFIGYLIVTA